MNRNEQAICAICALLGVVAPWLLILASGAIGWFSANPYWEKTAAYLAFSGFALLALSYLGLYFAHTQRRRGDN